MTRRADGRKAGRRLHAGAVAVEFALIAALFLVLLLVGIVELGRAFFYMNATAEATRRGARIAVVCDKGSADEHVRAVMREFVRVLPASSIAIDWQPANCAAAGAPPCESVTVRVLPGATFETLIPFVPLPWTLPSFATTLPRESMRSDIDGTPNPVCD